jgi:hypothetical protein
VVHVSVQGCRIGTVVMAVTKALDCNIASGTLLPLVGDHFHKRLSNC